MSADVKCLQLDEVLLNLTGPVWWRFPALTHLSISDNRHLRDPGGTFFQHARLPALTALSVTVNYLFPCFASPSAATCLELQRVIPHLTHLALNERFLQLSRHFADNAHLLARLETLTAAVSDLPDPSEPLPVILHGIPSSLGRLEIAAGAPAAETAAAVIRSFEHGWKSTAGLKVLAMPLLEKLEVRDGQSAAERGSEGPDEAALKGVRRVAQLAEARGVRIEWV